MEKYEKRKKNNREIECHHQSPTILVIIIVTSPSNKKPLDLKLVEH